MYFGCEDVDNVSIIVLYALFMCFCVGVSECWLLLHIYINNNSREIHALTKLLLRKSLYINIFRTVNSMTTRMYHGTLHTLSYRCINTKYIFAYSIYTIKMHGTVFWGFSEFGATKKFN